MRIGGLQGRIIVFFVLLMLVVQVGGLALINTVGASNARNAIHDELVTAERVFARLLDQDAARLAQGARILAADYAFREALASNDHETIVSALGNHGARIDAQVMMLVGLDQVVVADTRDASHVGKRFGIPKLIVTAAEKGMSTSVVTLDGQLYQVVVVPVAAPIPVAWVAMGFAIDDRVAGDLQRITGHAVSFLSRRDGETWRMQATTLPATVAPVLVDTMARNVLAMSTELRMSTGNDDYLTLLSPQPSLGDEAVVTVLQQSLGDALLPFRNLQRQLFGVSLAGVLISILGSIAIARGIAGPVRQMAAFARRIANGDYADLPKFERHDEIGDLSSAFEHMREGIASRESKIMDLAYRDALTGLPNRALFSDRLQQAIRTSRRVQAPASVLVMDLDHFKYVNDTLGHPIGDLLLREVARRMQDVLQRESDTLARLGGDEFAVLLPTDDIEGARKVAVRMLDALEAPMTLDGHIVDTRASIGVASCPEHGDDLDGLMRRADVAMYLAKRNNSGYAIYDARDDRHTADRLSLMGELRRAVEEDQLVLYYQPKVSLTDRSIHCVEALVRWQHPKRGFIPPIEFIPFAEQTGYIRAITFWVLERAAAQCARWRREGLNITVSINISARDLMNPELPMRFTRTLEEEDCSPESIWLEITESAILEDTRHVLENLDRLSALGCKLSIDDYGTGYSSLSYLKKLPVHELKIDRSFVMGMATDRDDDVIVRSTIDLAHNMGLKVTAEGVENRQVLDRLAAMGCDMAQGYLMSKPIPADEVARWMHVSPWAGEDRRAPDLRLAG